MEHNFPAYLRLLLASGLKLNGLNYIGQIVSKAKAVGLQPPAGLGKLLGIKLNWVEYLKWISAKAKDAGLKAPAILDNFLEGGLLSDGPLHRLIDQYLEPAAIAKGLPLYVSVFKSRGALEDVFRVLTAEVGLLESPESEFIHIQTLPIEEQKNALLASAAIPLLFAPRRINDSVYSDGGMGGWQKAQGNTPITPLLQAGIKNVLVTHLSDGSLWSRHDFPEATVLEICPQSAIQREGGFKDIMGFDPHKIPSWIEQGYRDTLHCVGRVMEAAAARNERHLSESALANSEQPFEGLDQSLADAMARLC